MSSYFDFDFRLCCGRREKGGSCSDGDKHKPGTMAEDLFDRVHKLPVPNESWSSTSTAASADSHFRHTLPPSPPSSSSLRDTALPSTDPDSELPVAPKEIQILGPEKLLPSWASSSQLEKRRQWLLHRVGALGAMDSSQDEVTATFQTLLNHGITAFDKEQFSEAKTLFELAMARAKTDVDLARACGNLGNVHQVFEEFDKCIVLYFHSIQLLQRAGEKQREANILHMLEKTLEELKHSDMIVSVLKREIELQNEGIYPRTYHLEDEKQDYSSSLTEKLQYYETIVQTPTLI